MARPRSMRPPSMGSSCSRLCVHWPGTRSRRARLNSTEFRNYKSAFRNAIRAALAEAPPGSLDEAAFPAYAHPNPLIHWLFWQRLRTVMRYVERGAPPGLVLDFGCGSGVLLPLLARRASRVLGLDVDLDPFRQMSRRIDFPGHVEVRDARATPVESLPAASFDLVTALDVLEHVPDLPATLRALVGRLRPGGRLVVSGPTENPFYRLGRRLAGPEFTGGYHMRSISEVRRELGHLARVSTIARLYPPFVLFDIFVGRVREERLDPAGGSTRVP